MYTPISAAQVEQFRRNAKRISRALSISHSEALDRVACEQGFKNWSLLSKHSVPAMPPAPPRSAPLPAARARAPAPAPAPNTTADDQRPRYYLHGDQYEDNPDRYYCSRCDVFFEAGHFAEHGPHTGERFLDRLESWNKRDWRSRTQYRRPDEAPNLLEARARAARAQYQALRPAFNDWLLLQRKRARAGERRDNVALMSFAFPDSRGLPKTPKSLPQLCEHYERRGAQHFELEALEAGWDEFLAQRATNP